MIPCRRSFAGSAVPARAVVHADGGQGRAGAMGPAARGAPIDRAARQRLVGAPALCAVPARGELDVGHAPQQIAVGSLNLSSCITQS
ncbi:hypothetical protein EVAR_53021_1 [Eumeta japonica]|uniref:Uncharacterized protein n=1 Tax=Eumeta variegata TaxID=151549 RepID=A0A4C1XND8_EUMVA|nr:hypothetical protein EVAR_53021_1 [Eumeta japonica]